MKAKKVIAILLVAIVLIVLLICLQLTQAVTANERTTILGSYRADFSTMSTILAIIFAGMVFTKVVMIIATCS